MDRKRHFPIANLLAAAALLTAFMYTVFDYQNLLWVVVWICVTSTPILFRLVIIKRDNPVLLEVANHFSFSSGVLVCGLALGEVIRFYSDQESSAEAWKTFLPLSFYGLLFVLAVVFAVVKYMNKSLDSLEGMNTSLDYLMKQSGIETWETLFKRLSKSDANLLAVAGNAMSLDTDRGLVLLENYLRQSPDNIVELIVSHQALPRLKSIQRKLDSSLRKRVEVRSYRPFWFLQGVVIIGRRNNFYDNAFKPFGCFFYKIREGNFDNSGVSDRISEEGIFVPVPSGAQGESLEESITAQYFLFDKLAYAREPYEVKKTFRKGGAIHRPEHNCRSLADL